MPEIISMVMLRINHYLIYYTKHPARARMLDSSLQTQHVHSTFKRGGNGHFQVVSETELRSLTFLV